MAARNLCAAGLIALLPSYFPCRSHVSSDDETAPSASQIEVSPAPVRFADDLQVLTVDRSAKKGTPIGQIEIVNPGRRRLTWTMRHRYRYGGECLT